MTGDVLFTTMIGIINCLCLTVSVMIASSPKRFTIAKPIVERYGPCQSLRVLMHFICKLHRCIIISIVSEFYIRTFISVIRWNLFFSDGCSR